MSLDCGVIAGGELLTGRASELRSDSELLSRPDVKARLSGDSFCDDAGRLVILESERVTVGMMAASDLLCCSVFPVPSLLLFLELFATVSGFVPESALRGFGAGSDATGAVGAEGAELSCDSDDWTGMAELLLRIVSKTMMAAKARTAIIDPITMSLFGLGDSCFPGMASAVLRSDRIEDTTCSQDGSGRG